MVDVLWVVVGAVVLAVLAAVFYYNGFRVALNRIENAWAQIDVQLKRRNDLIPNLIETVKGYVKHEKGVLEEVTRARTSMMNAGSVQEKAAASNLLSGALKSLFAVAENYPQLKANENFLALQEELSSTENKIAFSRQHYNDSVLEYNNSIQVIPGLWFAGAFGFARKEMLATPEAERAVPKVKF
ncbi:MAG TPA: LemA family protein [archaeon]|nr:LemA family protein [archaeon]HLD80578.1 LemA family protein [archaeon]